MVTSIGLKTLFCTAMPGGTPTGSFLSAIWKPMKRLPGSRVARYAVQSGGPVCFWPTETERFRVWNVTEDVPKVVREGEAYGFAFHPYGRHLCIGSGGSLWTTIHKPPPTIHLFL